LWAFLTIVILRLIGAFFWGLLGAVAGAIDGAAFGWALGWPLMLSAQLGAVLAGGGGFIAGLLRRPRTRLQLEPERRETIFNLEPCAWCKATGREGKAQKQCSTCYGRGGLLVKQPSRKCSNCKGTGRVLLGRRCKVCNGAGWSTYAHLEGAAIHRQSRGRTKVAL